MIRLVALPILAFLGGMFVGLVGLILVLAHMSNRRNRVRAAMLARRHRPHDDAAFQLALKASLEASDGLDDALERILDEADQ